MPVNGYSDGIDGGCHRALLKPCRFTQNSLSLSTRRRESLNVVAIVRRVSRPNTLQQYLHSICVYLYERMYAQIYAVSFFPSLFFVLSVSLIFLFASSAEFRGQPVPCPTSTGMPVCTTDGNTAPTPPTSETTRTRVPPARTGVVIVTGCASRQHGWPARYD